MKKILLLIIATLGFSTAYASYSSYSNCYVKVLNESTTLQDKPEQIVKLCSGAISDAPYSDCYVKVLNESTTLAAKPELIVELCKLR